MKLKVVVYPGRFDPVTLGHIDIIKRSSHLFGQVIVAVSGDSEKSSFWQLEQRVAVMEDACQAIGNVKVESFSGLLSDWMVAQGMNYIVRGIRDSVDMSVEWRMAHSNRVLNREIETLFLASSPEVSHISSTLVRQIITSGGDVSAFVPGSVLACLAG